MQSTVESISEKVDNTEGISYKTYLHIKLNDDIKSIGRRESTIRALTITIKTDNFNSADLIMTRINRYANNELAIFNWQDNDNLYVRFSQARDMEAFLSAITQATSPLACLNSRILRLPDGSHQQLKRKPVRLEIQYVRAPIKLSSIISRFNEISSSVATFTNVREGKIIQSTNTRIISFYADSKAFELLFSNYDGVVVIEKSRLYPKIDLRPYRCRDCFSLNPRHKCKGKCCSNCCKLGHKSSECNSKTRFCGNCNAPGHKAKDKYCGKYLQEVIKLIQRIDIPLDYMKDEFMRSILIKNCLL